VNEHDALVAAILANPESDMPRLVYADWLQEQPSHIECGNCQGKGWLIREATDETRLVITDDYGFEPDTPRPATFGIGYQWFRCEACNGKKHIPTYYHERAEFIRVQCRFDELAAKHCPSGGICEHNPGCKLCEEREACAGRQDDLFSAHAWNWFTGVAPTVSNAWFERPDHYGEVPADAPVALIRRGYMVKVAAPLEWLRGRQCHTCQGEVFMPHRCPDCQDGTNPGNLRKIIKTQPVEFVGVTDREPMVTRDDGRYTWWGLSPSDNDDLHPQSNLPRQVLDRLKRRSPSIYAAIYATREDARKDLSEALLSEAREG